MYQKCSKKLIMAILVFQRKVNFHLPQTGFGAADLDLD